MKKRVGRKPFGYYSDEDAIVEMIRCKRRVRKAADGKLTSPYRIAIELNEQGFRTQKEKKFATQTVIDILKRIEGDQPKVRKRYAKKGQLEADDYRTADQVRSDRSKLKKVPGLLCIYDILVGTGMRAGELCALKAKDIDTAKGLISIRHGKNTRNKVIGKRRVIIAMAPAVRLLAELITGRGKLAPVLVNRFGDALSYEGLLYRVKKIAKIIGVPAFHPHTLRHTFAVVLYDARKDLLFVAQQLGHSNLKTTEIYAKCLNDSKLQQMEDSTDTLFGKIAV